MGRKNYDALGGEDLFLQEIIETGLQCGYDQLIISMAHLLSTEGIEGVQMVFDEATDNNLLLAERLIAKANSNAEDRFYTGRVRGNKKRR